MLSDPIYMSQPGKLPPLIQKQIHVCQGWGRRDRGVTAYEHRLYLGAMKMFWKQT